MEKPPRLPNCVPDQGTPRPNSQRGVYNTLDGRRANPGRGDYRARLPSVKTTLSFFRHRRADGWLRTGVEIDYFRALESFGQESARLDSHLDDAALLWFVDLDFQGEALPRDPEAARRWLADHAALANKWLTSAANRCESGTDVGSWPLLTKFRDRTARVYGLVRCSALRRVDQRQLATHLRVIASSWEAVLARLEVLEPVS